jgi:hypothetical protein
MGSCGDNFGYGPPEGAFQSTEVALTGFVLTICTLECEDRFRVVTVVDFVSVCFAAASFF